MGKYTNVKSEFLKEKIKKAYQENKDEKLAEIEVRRRKMVDDFG